MQVCTGDNDDVDIVDDDDGERKKNYRKSYLYHHVQYSCSRYIFYETKDGRK